MKNLAVIFLSLSLLFSNASFADGLTLAELIDMALKNNPETEKAWWSAKRSQEALGIAKSTLYPTIDVQANATHAREVKFPNGPNTVFTSGGAELSLSYLLFDFGERSATIQAAKDALKAANWSSDFAIQQIIYKVCANYYEYLNARVLLETKECSLNDADLIHNSAEELCKAGLRSSADLNMSRAAVAQIKMDLAQQRAHVLIAHGKLMTTLGLDLKTELNVETMPEGMKTSLFSEGIPALIKLAEEQRADLLAKKATLSEMNERVRRAKKAPLPKFRALGQGGWLEYTKHRGSGYNYSAGVALEIPIFRGFEYTYQKRLAYAEAEITLAELKELKEMIALEVLTYSESAKAAEESFQWSQEYLEEAAKSYDGSMQSYKAGLQNIFDLLQAQRYLADARIKRAQARTQWLVSLAELAFATGSIIK